MLHLTLEQNSVWFLGFLFFKPNQYSRSSISEFAAVLHLAFLFVFAIIKNFMGDYSWFCRDVSMSNATNYKQQKTTHTAKPINSGGFKP